MTYKQLYHILDYGQHLSCGGRNRCGICYKKRRNKFKHALFTQIAIYPNRYSALPRGGGALCPMLLYTMWCMSLGHCFIHFIILSITPWDFIWCDDLWNAFCGAIQVLRNAFFLKLDPPPPPWCMWGGIQWDRQDASYEDERPSQPQESTNSCGRTLCARTPPNNKGQCQSAS